MECWYPTKLFLVLEKDSQIKGYSQKVLRFEVGDGKTIHLLMDCWHPDGILLDRYGYRAVYDAQSSVEAKLPSMIHNGDWF
jgi:hypothetical protein